MPSPRPRDQDVHQTDFVKERKRRIDFEEHFTEIKYIVPEVAARARSMGATNRQLGAGAGVGRHLTGTRHLFSS